MKIHRIHSGAGESLVEVTVSAVIFLIMMAVLQGSISFCTNAQHIRVRRFDRRTRRFAGTYSRRPTFPAQKT